MQQFNLDLSKKKLNKNSIIQSRKTIQEYNVVHGTDRYFLGWLLYQIEEFTEEKKNMDFFDIDYKSYFVEILMGNKRLFVRFEAMNEIRFILYNLKKTFLLTRDNYKKNNKYSSDNFISFSNKNIEGDRKYYRLFVYEKDDMKFNYKKYTDESITEFKQMVYNFFNQ